MHPYVLLFILVSLVSPRAATAAPSAREGPQIPVELIEMARDRAGRAWTVADGPELPAVLAKLDYDAYRRLRFRPEASLWRREARQFEVRFHHRGYLFLPPVRIVELTPEGRRAIPYDASQFETDGWSLPDDLGADFGFAGLSVLFPLHEPESRQEVASFLGATYFRLVSEGQGWGASTRGLAIDTGRPEGEEFPHFVEFWIERPESEAREVVLHALLDSPGVTGAYTFQIAPGAETSVHVAARLFARHSISKLGLAPLTSMFFFSESSALLPPDYRPEVHDSDGLLIEERDGDRVWRPLSNPAGTHRITRFELEDVRGFGLMQRDRRFESYQDLESRFERRPSLWVEPTGAWGPGAVELIEIPTASESNDNVVAFWVPDEPFEKGDERSFSYRLRATSADSVLHPGLRVHATRRAPLPRGGTRFVVDFVRSDGANGTPSGPRPLASFEESELQPDSVDVQPNPVTGGWRVVFDVHPPGEREYRLSLDLEPDVDAPPDEIAAGAERWQYVVRAQEGP